ncbi:MAG: hypothetical protein MHMPM18_002806 [Marteilia pararefringens]
MSYHRLQFLIKAISYAIFESDTTQTSSANFLTLAALTILIKYPSSNESLAILQSVLNDYIAAYPDSPNFSLQNKFVKLIEISPYFSLGLITAACSTLLIHHHEFPSQSLCCFFQICCRWLADHKDIFASLLNVNNILALKETLLVSVAEAIFRFIEQFCISYEYIEDIQLIVSLFKVSHHLIDFFMRIELTGNSMNINSGVHCQNGATNLYGMNPKLAELAENTFSQLVAHWEQKSQVSRGEQLNIATSLFAIFTQTLYFACGKGLLPSDTLIFKRVIKYLPKQLFHSSLFLKSIS